MNIRYMYFFENSLSIFPIDRRFRFMIFSARGPRRARTRTPPAFT